MRLIHTAADVPQEVVANLGITATSRAEHQRGVGVDAGSKIDRQTPQSPTQVPRVINQYNESIDYIMEEALLGPVEHTIYFAAKDGLLVDVACIQDTFAEDLFVEVFDYKGEINSFSFSRVPTVLTHSLSDPSI